MSVLQEESGISRTESSAHEEKQKNLYQNISSLLHIDDYGDHKREIDRF
jgi:hypothetical protein